MNPEIITLTVTPEDGEKAEQDTDSGACLICQAWKRTFGEFPKSASHRSVTDKDGWRWHMSDVDGNKIHDSYETGNPDPDSTEPYEYHPHYAVVRTPFTVTLTKGQQS